MIKSASKDHQHVTPGWQRLVREIEGVSLHEMLHVPRDHGVITEIYRPEWDPTGKPVVQVYQSRLFPGAIGAWSCHKLATDRLFVSQGHLKIVLYDGREDSPTYRTLQEYHAGDYRPAFLVLPPGVWHGVQNLGTDDAILVNLPTRGYVYEDPDHYRLPYNTPEIPYRWTARESERLRADGLSEGMADNSPETR
jgi:dTDP-4-dehydrorhamnose 3,5-epimerase